MIDAAGEPVARGDAIVAAYFPPGSDTYHIMIRAYDGTAHFSLTASAEEVPRSPAPAPAEPSLCYDVRSAMRLRHVLVFSLVATVGLAGCAAPGPTPAASTPPAPSPAPEPAVSEPSDLAACVRPEAAAVLDACAVAGEEAQSPLPRPDADQLLARAEEAWAANRWADCAELHTELARRHPDVARRAESAYAAVLCVNNREEAALTAGKIPLGAKSSVLGWPAPPRPRHPMNKVPPRGSPPIRRPLDERDFIARMARRELTPVEATMAEAYARYECLAPEGDERVTVRYRRTRLHYVANQWDEAATLFRDLAFGHPAAELASFAVLQWLDSLNALSMIDPRRRDACRDELARGVEAVLANETLMRSEELRMQMTGLQCSIWWREAETLEGEQRWLEAAERLLRTLDEHGDECRQIGTHHECELLYNAAIYADEGRDTSRAIAIRERLIATCGEGTEHAAARGGRGSEWAKRVVARLGDDYRATGAHAKAAEMLEGFARQWPGERDAIDALETAAGLRVGLGQGAQALADLALFERNYGGRPEHRARVASVVFTVGAVHLRAKAWTQAERHYAAFLRRYRDVARPDEVIRATVELGTSRWERAGAAAPRRGAGLQQAREAVALADAGGAPDEGPAARLARYRSLVARGGEPEETIAARLALLVDAVARARVRLSTTDPPGDSLRPLVMPVDQAERVLLGL